MSAERSTPSIPKISPAPGNPTIGAVALDGAIGAPRAGLKPWLEDADVRLYHGDALETLREFPAESVDCVVTSPPFWGLRDYGTGRWDGGDAECDHKASNFDRGDAGSRASADTQDRSTPYRDICGKCGATRIDQQLGLESTPEQYVERMVEVFREVRRVLAAHGTVWLNLGDSYAQTEQRHRHDKGPAEWGTRGGEKVGGASTAVSGLKPKDLCGIPWRVAFALQTDGWYLRSDIIWSKPNPMPESVTDRPTKAHEYLFLLSKQPRYFFDTEAVREEYAPKTLTHRGGGKAAGKVGNQDGLGKVASGNYGDWDKPRTAHPRPRPQEETLDGSDGEAPRGPDGRRNTHVEAADGSIQHRDGERWPNGGRNIRSVWEIATQPYPDAHFATFPEELARRAIAAGCPEAVCRVCGKARERIVKPTPEYDAKLSKRLYKDGLSLPELGTFIRNARITAGFSQKELAAKVGVVQQAVSWWEGNAYMQQAPSWEVYCRLKVALELDDRFDEALQKYRESTGSWGSGNLTTGRVSPPSATKTVSTSGFTDCGHSDYRSGVTLDPFIGSGTVCFVARKLGRHSIGIDLSSEYLELAARRLQQQSLFAEAAS